MLGEIMNEVQRIIRCSLGGEQFLYVHKEASRDDLVGILPLGFRPSALELDFIDVNTDTPWAGYVHSATLMQWFYRGMFSNEQVNNMVDFTS
jgi:hypothetical protein